MAWVSLDDRMLHHPKIAAVGALGFAVHVAGIIYCGEYLTDGLVPKPAAKALLNLTDLGSSCLDIIEHGCDDYESLIEANLWHLPGHDCPECLEVPNRKYRIHDYLKYNPTREVVEIRREMARDRQRKHRKGNGQFGPWTGEPWNADVTRD